MTGGIALDPNVLYQFKIATSGVASNSLQRRHRHSVHGGLRRNGAAHHALRTRQAERSRNDATRPSAKTGTFEFGKVATLKGGIKVFVGPRRDPFFFDLAQFFKIIPDRNYMNHPNPPPPTATSFRFASAQAEDHSQRTRLRDGGFQRLRHREAARLPSALRRPLDRDRNAQKVARAAGGSPGVIALWATTATPDGQLGIGESTMTLRYKLGLVALASPARSSEAAAQAGLHAVQFHAPGSGERAPAGNASRLQSDRAALAAGRQGSFRAVRRPQQDQPRPSRTPIPSCNRRSSRSR